MSGPYNCSSLILPSRSLMAPCDFSLNAACSSSGSLSTTRFNQGCAAVHRP